VCFARSRPSERTKTRRFIRREVATRPLKTIVPCQAITPSLLVTCRLQRASATPSEDRPGLAGEHSSRHSTQLLPYVVTFIAVGKFRRGGYVFITWIGDHPPRHVHVYRDGKLVVKWDLDNQKPMKGTATRRILELIAELESEGLL
jgi:hypothetical protein